MQTSLLYIIYSCFFFEVTSSPISWRCCILFFINSKWVELARL